MPTQRDAYDSPWKEALERYLRPIIEFCFSTLARGVRWEAGFEFLDKELQEVVRDAALGVQHVDKLIKVQLVDGQESWILLHVEVQHWPEAELARRMYEYHHRLEDRFKRPVVSLVILADEDPNWRPCFYEWGLLGCRVRFDFPICKLLDLLPVVEAALDRGEPSAVIVLANWLAQQTRGDMAERLRGKWALTRRFYEAGFSREDVLELYRFIDWFLALPEAEERMFKQQVDEYEQSKAMPYITSIERISKQEGLAEGRVEALRESILEVIEARFGIAPAGWLGRVQGMRDIEELKRWHRRAATCGTLAELERELGA